MEAALHSHSAVPAQGAALSAGLEQARACTPPTPVAPTSPGLFGASSCHSHVVA